MLGIAATALIAGAAARPGLPAEQTYATADGHFLLHYTEQGADAIDPAKLPWAEEGLARLWAAYVDGDGWPAPAPDEGLGGDDRLDVYLHVIDANGYAHTEALPSGAVGCWVELDPGIAGISQASFESVAGHELHHCLQFAVTTGLAPWIYEATSTYVQYLEYTGDDQALVLAREALWRLRLAGAATAVDDVAGTFEYAGFIWPKLVVDRAGDRAALLAYWRDLAAAGTWELPSTPDDMVELARWEWFACDRDEGGRWADDPAACTLDAHVRPQVTAGAGAGVTPAIGRYGSAFVEITPDCATADLHVEVTATGPVRVQLIPSTPWAGSSALAGDAPTSFDVPAWNALHEVVVTATALDGSSPTVTWTATTSGAYTPPAAPPPLAAIALAPSGPLALAAGDRAPVAATAVYGTCADGAALAPAWTSTDPEVAVVEGDEVVAVGPGAATLTARVGDVTATLDVTVTGDDADAGCGCHAGGAAGGLAAPALAALVAVRRRRRPPVS